MAAYHDAVARGASPEEAREILRSRDPAWAAHLDDMESFFRLVGQAFKDAPPSEAVPTGVQAPDPPAVTAERKPAQISNLFDMLRGIFPPVVVAERKSGQPRPVVPGYEIFKVLGQGGMGIVYQARQVTLNRIVALKMIRDGSLASAGDLERFRTEAEAIARLQHPNIVQIYEVGEHDGPPFFSLEYCLGGSLATKLSGTPLPPNEAAVLVETLARAMQAAHDKGVIHRDLKPANVLLGEDGTPKITDFGLAKKLDDEGQTQTGLVMGTPSYMAPEQAAGRTGEIGPLVDVYALAAILYECLTGRPPFKAATMPQTLRQVLEKDPVPPRTLNAAVPRDLETICLKGLHKEPAKRYESAAALADDLGRFLRGEPIVARPVGTRERLVKWVRRNPVVAALLALVVLVSTAGGTLSYVKYLDAEEQRGIVEIKAREVEAKASEVREEAKAKLEVARLMNKAVQDREEALQEKNHEVEEKRKAVEQRQEQLNINAFIMARGAWQNNKPAEALHALNLVPANPPRMRHFEWHYLHRLYEGSIFTISQNVEIVTGMAFSPDGTRLATVGCNTVGGYQTVRLWDARTGQHLLDLKGRQAADVSAVAFSPDGTRLATPNWDHTARLWDARTGQQLLELKGHTGAVYGVAFSPDGTRLATAGADKTARLWDTRTGSQLREFQGHTGAVYRVAFSPDGTRLATASEDKTALLWDAKTGQPLRDLKGLRSGVSDVTFSPDGMRLATASFDGAARLWDASTGESLWEKGFVGGAGRVAFSPDGTCLATTGYQSARLLTASGEQFLEFKGHTGQVTAVAFSPDGMRLATASVDRTVRLWNARTGPPVLQLQGHTESLTAVAYSPDGTRLATASRDKTARLWDARTGQPLFELKGHTEPLTDVAFSPDGTRLATASWDRTVRLWDVKTGQALLKPKDHASFPLSVAFSPDGTRLATVDGDRARVWDIKDGPPLLEFKGHTGRVTAVAFSPDRTHLATGEGQTARLWDAKTGQPSLVFKGHTGGEVTAVAFSPDGTRLATASTDQTARLWDARTGLPLLELKGHMAKVDGVAFSPDGMRLATGGGGEFRLWDTRTGNQVLEFQVGGALGKVAFSPDGTTLVTTEAGKTARLWYAGTGALDAPELAYRKWATRPDPEYHAVFATQFENGGWHFAALFHLSQLLELRPEDVSLRLRRAHQYVYLNQLPQAAADYARASQRQPVLDPEVWLEHAGVCLMTDDKEGYRRLRTLALEHRPDKPNPRAAYLIARLCALDPDPKFDLEPALKLLAQALEADPKKGEYLHTLGLLHYCAGHYEEAAKVFKDAPDWDNLRNELGLALAYHHLGKTDEARKRWNLTKLRPLESVRIWPKSWQTTLPMHPHDWLGCLLLRREAETCFGDTKPAGSPPPAK
jgi:WD40 repeat protein/tRNA A-37 threonylcarbamoyl transferase component Bud32